MILAGTPTNVQLSGASTSTTAFAPIFTLSPMTISPKTHAPAPITQFLPIIGPPALPIVTFKYISTDNTKFSIDKLDFRKCFDVYANNNSMPPEFYQVKDISTSANSVFITYYTAYPFSVTSTAQLPVQIADTEINDNIFEL